jgi:hypothetical protein
VGEEVGAAVVGEGVGPTVGELVGSAVVGETVGPAVGEEVGPAVVGEGVGAAVGELVGAAVVGEEVGPAVVVVGEDEVLVNMRAVGGDASGNILELLIVGACGSIGR